MDLATLRKTEVHNAMGTNCTHNLLEISCVRSQGCFICSLFFHPGHRFNKQIKPIMLGCLFFFKKSLNNAISFRHGSQLKMSKMLIKRCNFEIKCPQKCIFWVKMQIQEEKKTLKLDGLFLNLHSDRRIQRS